jgi:hemolysin III
MDDEAAASTRTPARWTPEEIANTLTHLVGLLLAIVCVPLLITAAAHDTAATVAPFGVYGAALILTYLVSTLYHGAPHGVLKRALHRLDHMAIYLLIAGTYTPFLIVGLRGVWGWSLFVVLWGLAAVGLGIEAFFPHRLRVLSTSAYVLMGWAGLAAIVPLSRSLPHPSFVLVLAGGLSYTLGAAFYLWRRLEHHHAIWHLFCLGGSVLQFIAVLYLLP